MIFGVSILAAILFPVFAQARQKARQFTCVQHGNQLGLAASSYAQDHQGRLPHASQWMDDLAPYAKETAFHCPSVSGEKTGRFGYAYNSALDTKPLSSLQQANTDVMIFDSTNDGRNASDSGTSLPQPGRHLGRNVLVFVDGHAKASAAATVLDPVQ